MFPYRLDRKAFLVPDSLVHSSGTITATFGVNAYAVGVGTPTANTLYFLYLRSNAGVPQLVSSTSVPSVYRVSQPEALLVGAYYSDGVAVPVFGSFVNIEGVPKSQIMAYTPTLTGETNGLVYTNQVTTGRVRYDGDQMYIEVNTGFTGTPGTGTGRFYWRMPKTVDINKMLIRETIFSTNCTTGGGNNLQLQGVVIIDNTANFAYVNGHSTTVVAGSWNPTFPSASIINLDSMGFRTTLPFVGGTNTPLKDL